MENNEIQEEMPTLIARRKLKYYHTGEAESTTSGDDETLMVYTFIVKFNIFSVITGAHFKKKTIFLHSFGKSWLQ